MKTTKRLISAKKRIALVAHDNCKEDLNDWCQQHKEELSKHQLYSTGTTGHVLRHDTQLDIKPLLSGPMGGDQQLGSMIADQRIDMLIFFWDPLNAVPHDPDVKALLRISTVWNIPVAMSRATANFLIHSPFFSEPVEIIVPDYDAYLDERLGRS